MVALVISLALFFDFTNGFHDTANAMATPIATGAIKPKTAVALAAVLNLVGAFLSTEVAKTVSGGIIKEGSDGVQITPDIIFAGLMGAILWNMITWLKGLPSSSSHALFGGLIGAAIAGIGIHSINFESLLQKIILPAVFAPVIAGGVAYLCTRLAYALTSRHDPETGDKLTQKRGGFRTGHVFTSSLVALAHGTNDAQKTMGIITLVLISAGTQPAGSGPEWWVITACAFAIAIGTYSGGWRIIRTMGSGLTEVKPAQGFCRRDQHRQQRSWRRRTWASPCPPRRWPPAQSSAPAWDAAAPPCGGEPPAGLPSAGCSRCRRPESWAR